eukprot:TRINITY_DN22806_c0_g1_i4.p2 TRINITY_DN22806_c0_g1~~TRINITY_DN22806_c0_g1_i4.p2  ORF type:complete len:105 (-),score=15.85 TRINITY_DN22806_c0_g1_i4:416-730(-)
MSAGRSLLSRRPLVAAFALDDFEPRLPICQPTCSSESKVCDTEEADTSHRVSFKEFQKMSHTLATDDSTDTCASEANDGDAKRHSAAVAAVGAAAGAHVRLVEL